MVSNTLKIDLQEVLDALERIQREHGREPVYRKMRRELPEDWPV